MRYWLVPLLGAVAAASHGQTICIDPGHPSEVGRGASGKRITEIRAAWKVAQELKVLLEQDGYTVVLTKSSEGQLVKNRDRAAIANKNQADYMVRLHCDSQVGSGFDLYVPMRAGSINGKRGPSSGIISRSTGMGKAFYKSFAVALKGTLKDNGLHGDDKTAVGRKHGALIGSIYSEVPTILVEMCRLSNAKDEAFIASTDGQRKMASAIRQGVRAAVPVRIGRSR
jgi:N-acetylmuramoyl-L-alanine amidase